MLNWARHSRTARIKEDSLKKADHKSVYVKLTEDGKRTCNIECEGHG